MCNNDGLAHSHLHCERAAQHSPNLAAQRSPKLAAQCIQLAIRHSTKFAISKFAIQITGSTAETAEAYVRIGSATAKYGTNRIDEQVLRPNQRRSRNFVHAAKLG